MSAAGLLATALVMAAGLPMAYAVTRRLPLALLFAPLSTALLAALAITLMLATGGPLWAWFVVVFAVALAGAVLLVRRVRRGVEPLPHGGWWDAAWYALPLVPPLLLALLSAPEQWDAHSIWWLHAAYYLDGGEVARQVMASPAFVFTHADYPPLASAPLAVVWAIATGYEFRVAQMVSTLLTFSAITTMVYAVRRVTAGAPGLVSRVAAVGVGLAVWSTAPWSVGSGMSDPIWATTLVAGATLLLIGDRPFDRPVLPLLLLTAAALTKNEGFVAVGIAAVLVTLRERRNLRRAWKVWLPVAAGLGWVLLARRIGATNDMVATGNVGGLLRLDPVVLDRLDPVLDELLRIAGTAAGLALAAAVLGTLFLRARRRRLRMGSDGWLWALGLGYTASLTFTYLISPYDVHWHLATSATRVALPLILLPCVSVAGWAAAAIAATGPPPRTGPDSPKGPLVKLSILMPVYNEEIRLPEAVKQALDAEYPCDIELIVVDDGSSDGTADILDRLGDDRVRPVHHDRNRGKGAAIRTAAGHATGEYLVILDADLEYDPRDIAALLRPVLEGRATVVFGNRTFGGHSAFSFWYVMGNRAVTTAANILFNCYIGDLETCFKLMPVELYHSLDVRSRGFGMEAEVTGKLLRRGIRPYEVPISYRARTRDEGKKITWRDGVAALCILARERARPR